jgi:hypothetical protein
MSARQMIMLLSVGGTKGKLCRVGSDPVCDILTALTVYMTFFWNVTLYVLVEI